MKVKELELRRKLYGVYDLKCVKCGEVKHRLKFKRFNSIHKVCNDCFLGEKKSEA